MMTRSRESERKKRTFHVFPDVWKAHEHTVCVYAVCECQSGESVYLSIQRNEFCVRQSSKSSPGPRTCSLTYSELIFTSSGIRNNNHKPSAPSITLVLLSATHTHLVASRAQVRVLFHICLHFIVILLLLLCLMVLKSFFTPQKKTKHAYMHTNRELGEKGGEQEIILPHVFGPALQLI